MKNIFRYLGVFAIASTLGLQVMNVSAADECPDGQTLHTNYYLFLDVNGADYYETQINAAASGTSFTLWNGAYKYNGGEINKDNLLKENNVAIVSGSDTTSSSADMEWTVTEYWKKYYTASRNKDSNLVYTTGDESYFLHDKWWTYDENYTNGVEKTHSSTATADALSSYILGNWSNLAASDLVTKGTSLPTSNIDRPSNLETSTSTALMWHISRVFATKDIKTGVTLNSAKYVYSPAAYYVQYCVESEDTTTEKTITYDPNTTETVVNLPSPTKFTDNCTNISSATPTREGYSFVGWSATKGSTVADPKYAPESEYCGGDITLYAVWAEKQRGPFTVTYNANGGKDAPADQTSSDGSCINISTQKPTLTNNNFLGWSTDKDAKEADHTYDPGKEYCGEANSTLKLYAVWQTQTGVSAHFIAFGIVAIAAGAMLILAKKKDLFKQI